MAFVPNSNCVVFFNVEYIWDFKTPLNGVT